MAVRFSDCKKLVECVTIALGACSLVVLVAVITLNSQPVERGMGGFETPGMPVVSEAAFEGIDAAEIIEEPSQDSPALSYSVYRVKPGDMIGIIAENAGVTQDTLISVNNIRSTRLLQIGAYLKIPSIPGVLYTVKKDGETIASIAEKYEVDSDKCATVNHVALFDSLGAGTTVFVPDGEMDSLQRAEINGDLFKKPIHSSWYLTSYFGYRASPFTGQRSYHSGVDMACRTGTPIYAAMPGRVSSTGFNNTYGNYVIITHHSGYQTLYGHMSRITTKNGAVVNFDTKIGEVGSTGMSTGPHLHFTVYKNGRLVNPMALWN